jgi:hypothetical protein
MEENGYTNTGYTALELVGTNKPYIFRSLGLERIRGKEKKYVESTLFPIGTEVELTSGKFPFDPKTSARYDKSKTTYVIGGKTVRIMSYTWHCEESGFTRGDHCKIHVMEHVSGGSRRRRGARRSTRRSARGRRSTHR